MSATPGHEQFVWTDQPIEEPAAPLETEFNDVVIKESTGPLVKTLSRKMKIVRMVYYNGTDEAITIDNLNTEDPFYLRLEMVLHDYESHFRIHARFDRPLQDQDHITGEYRRIHLNLPHIAFSDVLDQALINKADDLSDLPVELQKNPLVQNWLSIDQFSIVEFNFDGLYLVNLHSPFSAKTAEAQSVLQKLRSVKNTKGTIKLYVHGGKSDRNSFGRFREDLFKESAPLAMYMDKNGGCDAHWGQRKDQKDTLSHSVAAQNTFSTDTIWYISNVYGVLRDAEYSSESIKAIQQLSRDVFLFKVPGRELADGRHRQYLAFLEVGHVESSSPALQIGRYLYITWADPNREDAFTLDDEANEVTPDYETDPRPSKWRGQVLPPIPGLVVPGNLLLLINRPKGDTETLTANETMGAEMVAAENPIWLVPHDSNLSAKRLINALNLVKNEKSEKYTLLRRILRATDFSRMAFGNSLHQSYFFQTHALEIKKMSLQLSPSQQVVWDRIVSTSEFMEYIAGPFGTGKTTFITFLTRCLVLLGKKVLLCCSSNAAVDTLAGRINEAAPELRAVRFHALSSETAGIKTTSQRRSKDPITEDAVNIAKRSEKVDLIPLTIFLAKEARAGRPNFGSMSLMARCLALAGVDIDEDDEPRPDHPYAAFRDLFFRGKLDDRVKMDKADDVIEELQTDVIKNSSVILTTFSNSGDEFLKGNFFPQWIIGDEVGATQEAESLIPITSYMPSLERILGVGDGQQLPPVVLSHKQKNSDGGMVNEFAEGQMQPLITRLQKAGLRVSLFQECHRCTAGLEQPSSKLFYNNQVISGPQTALSLRSKSQKTVVFLQEEYGYETQIPRIVFDLQNGVCLTGLYGSRYNLHNIAKTMDLVETLVGKGLFDPSEIAIQSPYREQNSRYRAAMAKASRTPFWGENRDIWAVKLLTVDSFRGGERPCVIFDMVIATTRKGRLGFLQQYRRLNVALTRCQDALFIIADIGAILDQTPVEQALAEGELLDPESQGQNVKELSKGQGVLKKIADYYVEAKCTHVVDIKKLSQRYVSFKEAEDFVRQTQKICHNCQQPGHISSNCKNPAVPKPIKCRLCGEDGHKVTECPERTCHNCGQKGHFRPECQAPRTRIANPGKRSEVGQLKATPDKSSEVGQRNETPDKSSEESEW